MTRTALPSRGELMRAFMGRDGSYDGVFFTGVVTTGIFCRVTCPARKPKRQNVRFFGSRQEALAAGFRPCLRCRPLDSATATPDWMDSLVRELETTPRITATRLRERGLHPARVRRGFVRHYGMTFTAFQRSRRLGAAFAEMRRGSPQSRAALDAGYDSLSGFRDAYRRVFGTTPGRGSNVTIGYMHQFETPLGAMVTVCTDSGVRLLEFLDRRGLETELRDLGGSMTGAVIAGENAMTRQVERELGEYFDGKRREFTLPLEPEGTPFQQRVWKALCEIPYGATRSYGEQARTIGQPEAVRAVARANGDNHIAIVIPCHRVIGANGKLTGYGGGLWRKQYLLDLEGAQGVLRMGAAG